MRWAREAALCGAALMMGCGPMPARIHRVDGATRAGVITGSDAETVWVRQPGGREVARIARAEIAEIEHPGGVGLVLGPVMLVSGAVTAVAAGVGLADDGSEGGLAPTVLVLMPLAIFGAAVAVTGVGMTTASGRARLRSEAAAAPPGGGVSVGPGGVSVRF